MFFTSELASNDLDKNQPTEASLTHHVLVCALQELGCLVQSLGTSSAPLVSEPSAGRTLLFVEKDVELKTVGPGIDEEAEVMGREQCLFSPHPLLSSGPICSPCQDLHGSNRGPLYP